MPEEPLLSSEPQEIAPPETEPQENVCQKCGSSAIEPGYALQLCTSCRNELAGTPVPVRVKLFLALITAVMLVALTNLPKAITAAIHFERGARAEASAHHLTALREYQAAAKVYGDSTQILARIFVAHYHNWELQEAATVLQKLGGREVLPRSAVQEINRVGARLNHFFEGTEELGPLLNKYGKDKSGKLITELRAHVAKKPNEVLWAYNLASQLYDREEYDEAERVLVKAMASNDDFDPGHTFLANIYREKRDFARAVACCDKVLQRNAESVPALTVLARIELKRGNDKQGLALAERAYALDKDEEICHLTLALAYHYNGRLAERDKYFQLYRMYKDSDDYNLRWLTSIINGERVWR